MTANDLHELTTAYMAHYPAEAADLQQLTDHVAEADDTILRRNNFIGHLTCAGFVMAEDTGRILLLHHRSLDKWLQPGGHFDPEDTSPLEAARREIQEETGFGSELTYVPADAAEPLMPFAIDVHHIPANPRKQEPAHYHYDFRYAFTLPHELPPRIDAHESVDYRWADVADFRTQDHTFPAIADKLQKLLGA